MPRYTRAVTTLILLALSITACADSGTAPSAPSALSDRSAVSAVKYWDANAAASWNERATALTKRRAVNVTRLYAYLSLAQLRAAEDAERIRPHPPTSAAIGAASAAVLTSFFAADAPEITAALDAQATAEPWPGAKHEDFAAGAAIGHAAAARVLAYAQGDRFGLTDPGTPPTGPGRWQWSGGPISRGALGVRPFFVASGDALRPPPPPAFGSPEFLAALAEVRQISDTRTAEQLRIAQYWNANQGPSSDAARNNLAVELLRTHRRSDVESARILFLMNAAAFDAAIGCFAAKYHYWFIRPPQADPAISLPIGLPPHPSYPSAHSCVTGASMAVLTAAFPGERARLADVAEEASLSRLYAGIHFRFDMVAGLALGRAAAAEAMAADLDGVAVR